VSHSNAIKTTAIIKMILDHLSIYLTPFSGLDELHNTIIFRPSGWLRIDQLRPHVSLVKHAPPPLSHRIMLQHVLFFSISYALFTSLNGYGQN
jgi:hypothetical protein